MGTAIVTLANRLQKCRSVNSTATSFASIVSQAAQPAGDAGTATGRSIITLADSFNGFLTQNAVKVVPYGLGDNNDVFVMRVYGWHRVGTDPLTDLWVPVKLVELTCTMSAQTGVAGTEVLNTELFCDTIALVGTSGNDDVSIDIVSPADDTIAHCVIDLKGSQLMEMTFDTTTGDPTSVNCLYSLL